MIELLPDCSSTLQQSELWITSCRIYNADKDFNPKLLLNNWHLFGFSNYQLKRVRAVELLSRVGLLDSRMVGIYFRQCKSMRQRLNWIWQICLQSVGSSNLAPFQIGISNRRMREILTELLLQKLSDKLSEHWSNWREFVEQIFQKFSKKRYKSDLTCQSRPSPTNCLLTIRASIANQRRISYHKAEVLLRLEVLKRPNHWPNHWGPALTLLNRRVWSLD